MLVSRTTRWGATTYDGSEASQSAVGWEVVARAAHPDMRPQRRRRSASPRGTQTTWHTAFADLLPSAGGVPPPLNGRSVICEKRVPRARAGGGHSFGQGCVEGTISLPSRGRRLQ